MAEHSREVEKVSNPFAPPAVPEPVAERRSLIAKAATVAGVLIAILVAMFTGLFICRATFELACQQGQLLFGAIAGIVLGVIAAFGSLVFLVRLVFRMAEKNQA